MADHPSAEGTAWHSKVHECGRPWGDHVFKANGLYLCCPARIDPLAEAAMEVAVTVDTKWPNEDDGTAPSMHLYRSSAETVVDVVMARLAEQERGGGGCSGRWGQCVENELRVHVCQRPFGHGGEHGPSAPRFTATTWGLCGGVHAGAFHAHKRSVTCVDWEPLFLSRSDDSDPRISGWEASDV